MVACSFCANSSTQLPSTSCFRWALRPVELDVVWAHRLRFTLGWLRRQRADFFGGEGASPDGHVVEVAVEQAAVHIPAAEVKRGVAGNDVRRSGPSICEPSVQIQADEVGVGVDGGCQVDPSTGL